MSHLTSYYASVYTSIVNLPLPQWITIQQLHSIMYTETLIYTNLLMVFDPHAQCVDQNGDHNPSSKVLAVHDLPECVTHQPPEAHNLRRRFAQPTVLLFGLPAVSPVPVVEVLGELVNTIAV